MHADTDDNTCPWKIRDRDGWRHGVLFTASADLLVSWYTASASLHRRTWTAAHHRYGALLRRVRQARAQGGHGRAGKGLPRVAPPCPGPTGSRTADPRCVHRIAPEAGLGSRRRRHLPDRLRHLPAPADGAVRATRVLAGHRRVNSNEQAALKVLYLAISSGSTQAHGPSAPGSLTAGCRCRQTLHVGPTPAREPRRSSSSARSPLYGVRRRVESGQVDRGCPGPCCLGRPPRKSHPEQASSP